MPTKPLGLDAFIEHLKFVCKRKFYDQYTVDLNMDNFDVTNIVPNKTAIAAFEFLETNPALSDTVIHLYCVISNSLFISDFNYQEKRVALLNNIDGVYVADYHINRATLLQYFNVDEVPVISAMQVGPSQPALLTEEGGFLLTEDGGYILL